MILNKKNKKHAEAIIKHCTDNGMAAESTMGLWNHLVRMFKRIEVLEKYVIDLKPHKDLDKLELSLQDYKNKSCRNCKEAHPCAGRPPQDTAEAGSTCV
jgi:hypothetical protein